MFTTPGIRHIFYFISLLCLKLRGWKLEDEPPKEKKYVLIAAPHTTNWDFPITMAICFVRGIRVYWMGKASLFKGVLGPIMRWCGGISIDRSKSNNTVQQLISAFNAAEELIVTIPVEGTRSKVDRWRTGFYHIAQGAGVPVGMAYIDYKRKVTGFGPTFHPTGDMDSDIATMQKFYEGISGLYEWIDGKKIHVRTGKVVK